MTKKKNNSTVKFQHVLRTNSQFQRRRIKTEKFTYALWELKNWKLAEEIVLYHYDIISFQWNFFLSLLTLFSLNQNKTDFPWNVSELFKRLGESSFHSAESKSLINWNVYHLHKSGKVALFSSKCSKARLYVVRNWSNNYKSTPIP